MSSETPMMKQYHDIKSRHRDAILLFRLGDFYEMFCEDAKQVAPLLDLTLTTRNKNQVDAIPLCGIPHHSAQGYINRLLANGLKVAICEQMEDPKLAKGIVKREVVQVFSPGMILDPSALEDSKSNYLASVAKLDSQWGLALVDISTGQFRLSKISESSRLVDELDSFGVRELLLEQGSEGQEWLGEFRTRQPQVRVNWLGDSYYDPQWTDAILLEIDSRDYLVTLQSDPLLTKVAGSMLALLHEGKLLTKNLLNSPEIAVPDQVMLVDETTRRNLEIFKTAHDHSERGSLYAYLRQTKSTLGARRLRDWLLNPLLNITALRQRYQAIRSAVADPFFLDETRARLSTVADLERIQNRVISGRALPRDLLALAESLQSSAEIKQLLSAKPDLAQASLLKKIADNLNELPKLIATIRQTLVDEPPASINEGGLIRPSISPELDELREIERSGKGFISRMEADERVRTGIGSLKVRYNRVFGYYIEITHTHSDKIPDNYQRKQTLTNAERYITPELKEYESRVLGAGERIKALEYELFCKLRTSVGGDTRAIKQNAQQLAELDVLLALALVARDNHLVEPELVEENILEIKQGRHPLIEKQNLAEPFVPNDIFLNETAQMLIITGPNMAGKSTIMRQVALSVYLAQIGSFVPAESARLGIVDRIFTRIGASDFLQRGQSTFMVEMLETAEILRAASHRSLIIMDEIGRGTSTFDGLSLAWAIAETIHDTLKARTLFATHYHELTDLAADKPRLKNFHLAVQESHGRLCFLRELRAGGSNRSFGVHVAAMAGLPAATINRAREILKILEKKDLAFQAETQQHQVQKTFFDVVYDHPLVHELKDLDINRLTPLEALTWLAKAKSGL